MRRIARRLTGNYRDAALAGGSSQRRAAAVALAAGLGAATYVVLTGNTSFTQEQVRQRFVANHSTVLSAGLPPEDGSATDRRRAEALGRMQTSLGEIRASIDGEVSIDGRPPSARLALAGSPVLPDAQVYATVGDPTDGHQGRLLAGRGLDAGFDRRGDAVAVVGETVADDLGLQPLDGAPQGILLAGYPYTVVGVVGRFRDDPELANAIFVPRSSARQMGGATVARSQVFVDFGTSDPAPLARLVQLAFAPEAPANVDISLPPTAKALEAGVARDLAALTRLAGLIAIVSGILIIAGVTYAGVTARVSEFGLRRALGARASDLVTLVALEAVRAGVFGAAGGALAGTTVVAGRFQSAGLAAPPVGAELLLIPLVGAAVALVGGLVPALVAARIEPSEALRS